jgi:hypothetical protein
MASQKLKETYPQARTRLFAEFRAMGCVVRDQLVVPQVELQCGETLMFHKRAVYTKSNNLSTWLDIRGMSAESLKYKTEKKRSLPAKEYFSEAGGTSNPIF